MRARAHDFRLSRFRAVHFTAPEQAEVREFPIPEPMPGEVLAQVSGVTTCPQWDLHVCFGRPMFAGGTLSFPYPVGQPGHEMTGIVAAIGAGMMGFKPGDTVSAWRAPYSYADNTLSLLGYPGHHRAAAEYALSQVVAGKLYLARMVTHHFPLEEYDHALKLLKAHEAVKVCFLPWR